MEAKEQLEKEFARIRSKLHAIEDTERRKEHDALKGKCFKFENSYGGDRPKWWMYALVLGSGGYWPQALTFQVTCDREIIIKERDVHTGMGKSGNGWQPITRREFDRQWRSIVKRVQSLQR